MQVFSNCECTGEPKPGDRSSVHCKWRTFLRPGLRFVIAAALSISVTHAKVQPAATGDQPAVTDSTESKNPPMIDIRIETFRKQIVAGKVLGVAADITNKSSGPIYLREQDIHLILPPEVVGPDALVSSVNGCFVTETREQDPRVLALKPNETYRIFWSQGPQQQSTTDSIRRRLWLLTFTPADYPIMVEAKYWTRRSFDNDGYHTAIETKPANFAAPQSIIVLGAILGGLIFTVLSWIRKAEEDAPKAVSNWPSDRPWTAGRAFLTIAGSILLSITITILLSRIQDTQFFIKVTVEDFWGAIAIGFFANYGGWKVLDKMFPAATTKAQVPTVPTNPPAVPA